MLVRTAPGFSKIAEATGRRRVLLTRHARNPLDQDNLAGGAKCIIDALKHWHILKDDSDEFAELIYKNAATAPPELGYTTLEISDLKPFTKTLEVGTNGKGEVVLVHPHIDQNAEGGYIVFSPAQARHLAALLITLADRAIGERE